MLMSAIERSEEGGNEEVKTWANATAGHLGGGNEEVKTWANTTAGYLLIASFLFDSATQSATASMPPGGMTTSDVFAAEACALLSELPSVIAVSVGVRPQSNGNE